MASPDSLMAGVPSQDFTKKRTNNNPRNRLRLPADQPGNPSEIIIIGCDRGNLKFLRIRGGSPHLLEVA